MLSIIQNINLLKKSGEVHLNDNLVLNVLSIFDEDSWIDPTDKNKINIALYHGSISGCLTDIAIGSHGCMVKMK